MKKLLIRGPLVVVVVRWELGGGITILRGAFPHYLGDSAEGCCGQITDRPVICRWGGGLPPPSCRSTPEGDCEGEEASPLHRLHCCSQWEDWGPPARAWGGTSSLAGHSRSAGEGRGSPPPPLGDDGKGWSTPLPSSPRWGCGEGISFPIAFFFLNCNFQVFSFLFINLIF